MTNFIDNPETDGTDAAHPAYWRGNDAGALTVTRRLRKALDGQDDGAGVIGNPEIEQLRRDVMKVQKQLADALARERQLREAAELVQAEQRPHGSYLGNECDCSTCQAWDTLNRTLSTPAPRVFTLADVRPLVAFAKDCSYNWDCDSDAHKHGVPCRTCAADAVIEHARKIGMEGV